MAFPFELNKQLFNSIIFALHVSFSLTEVPRQWGHIQKIGTSSTEAKFKEILCFTNQIHIAAYWWQLKCRERHIQITQFTMYVFKCSKKIITFLLEGWHRQWWCRWLWWRWALWRWQYSYDKRYTALITEGRTAKRQAKHQNSNNTHCSSPSSQFCPVHVEQYHLEHFY